MKTAYFLESLNNCRNISRTNVLSVKATMARIAKTAKTLQDKLQDRYDNAEEPEYDSQIEIFEERQERLEERIDALEEIINISENLSDELDEIFDVYKSRDQIDELCFLCDDYQTEYKGLKTLKLEEE